LASSHLRVASILDEIGSKNEALAALEKAKQIQEKLARNQPSASMWQAGLTAINRRLDSMRGRRELDLLDQQSVQEDLGLSAAQVEQASQLLRERREVWRQLHPRGFRDDSPTLTHEQWNATFDKLAAREKALADLLSAEQNQRLLQIVLQDRVPQAFSDPAVAAELRLTQEQMDRIRALSEERRALWSAGDSRPAVPRNRQQMEILLRDLRDQMLGVLTSDQKARWNALTGAPFKGELHHGHWHVGGGPFGGRGPQPRQPRGSRAHAAERAGGLKEAAAAAPGESTAPPELAK
jgi:hypothetical protein